MEKIPEDLINFVLVVLFSFFIGLEQRTHHPDEEELRFGTDRTFTLIGILGYILYVISKADFLPFLIGYIGVIAFLVIYYLKRVKLKKDLGLTSIFTAIITYSLAPLIYLQPIWLVLLIGVTILLVVEMKESIIKFSAKFDRIEFLTLAKFIIIAGIVLPLLSNKPISENFNISPYKFWITIVAVSSISYFSYLLKKFIFPDSGIILTAILGGLYSSTATTLILARKSKEEKDTSQTSAGIIAATAMMYLRLLVLAFIFNKQIALKLAPFFISLSLISVPFILIFWKKNKKRDIIENIESKRNPLEFKTAIVFGILFAFFAIITHLIVSKYGNMGVNILSLIVGVTDIDPYILSLFQGESANIAIETIVRATIIATASNNLIKMLYSIALGNKSIRKNVIIGFSSLIIVSSAMVVFFV